MFLITLLVAITTGCVDYGPDAVCNAAQHRVQPGETIFEIVDTYCDGPDIMPVVDDLVNLYGTNIHPWQVIIVPSK
jgi:hypothetical protein